MKTTITILILAFGLVYSSQAQNYKVDVEGDGTELIRIHSTPQVVGMAGIELLLGTGGGFTSGDWRIANDRGKLQFISDNNNFVGNGISRIAITRLGNFGIGVEDPDSKLHIDNGEEASLTGDGYLMIGSKSGLNMVFDQNEINGRNNGSTSSLYLQRHGGNLITGSGGGASYLSHGGGSTYTGFNGGNTHLAYGGGKVSVAGSPMNAKLNITDDNYQLYIRNDEDDINDWYIGASSEAWSVGDDNLVFSPNSTSSAAVLRLNDVTDNNGTVAPVVVSSAGGQRLLLDGNEIDASSPLYINHNTNANTYINPTGGKVGIGNSSPWGMLHVQRPNGAVSPCLALESQYETWGLGPTSDPDGDFYFQREGVGYAIAWVGAINGTWNIGSDRKLKENIESLSSVLNKVNNLGLYTYSLKSDPEHKTNIGVIAQELNEYFPELVVQSKDHLGVSYSQLSVVALKAIQELSEKNEKLESTLKIQQKAIDELNEKVNQLLLSDK